MIIDLEFTVLEVIFALLIIFFLISSILIINVIGQQKERNRLISAFAQFYAKNEMIKGVTSGYLNADQCPKCKNLFVDELFSHSSECPFCGLSFKKGNVIFKYKGMVKSKRKKVFNYLEKKGDVTVIREL